MNKGQRAGDGAIAVEVEVYKENLIFGVVVVKVQNNHFVMVHIKDLNLIQ